MYYPYFFLWFASIANHIYAAPLNNPPIIDTVTVYRRDFASSITGTISSTLNDFMRPFLNGEGLIKNPFPEQTSEGPSASRQITVDNRCHHAIHVGYQTNGAGDPQILPSLKPGEAINLQFKPDWSGRVWARPPCDKGDECTRVASAKDPASLAEFNFFDNNNQVSVAAGIDTDYYDVSFVDGFNLPIRVEPVVDSKFRNGYYCTRTECTELPSCPEDLQVLDSQGRIVGCESACSKYGTEQYCCTGDFGTAETCLNSVNPFATVVEQQCPNVYSFAYDDATSMYTCNQALLYQVTFCPDS